MNYALLTCCHLIFTKLHSICVSHIFITKSSKCKNMCCPVHRGRLGQGVLLSLPPPLSVLSTKTLTADCAAPLNMQEGSDKQAGL